MNILQKPTGVAAILAAAIGGPYAAFETDAGSTLRKTIARLTSSPSATQGESAEDPYSLIRATENLTGTSGSPLFTPNGSSLPAPPNSPNNVLPMQGIPPGQPVSVSYGQPMVQPPGTSYPVPGNPQTIVSQGSVPVPYYTSHVSPQNLTPYNGAVPSNSTNIESKQGPSTLVPGGTSQLWNYTVGVPSLQNLQQQPTSIGGGEVHDLREVLRFDITPQWLPQRFSRVTTVLSNVQFDGLRVPLMTGTRPTDLAGTLTYYFDSSQTLRRIQLHGLTGDAAQLNQLMVQYYGLKPEQSLGGQLFTTRWNNRVANVLHISPAPIIYSGADHSKYIVFLELNQAVTDFGLSPDASDLLRNSQAAQRW
jgi:hypothetical protein